MKISKTQTLYLIIFALLMSHVPWINWHMRPSQLSEGQIKAVEFAVNRNMVLNGQKTIDSLNRVYDLKPPIIEVKEVVYYKWREKSDVIKSNLDSLEKLEFIINELK